MNRRSRGGCIDCRKAKVKCDEIKPHCGTCKRRRHVCQGYTSPTTTGGTMAATSYKATLRQHRRQSSKLKQEASPPRSSNMIASTVGDEQDDDHDEDEDDDDDDDDDDDNEKEEGGDDLFPKKDAMTRTHTRTHTRTASKRPFSRFHEPVTTGYSSITVPKAGHPLIMDPIYMTPRALGLIPPGVVSSTDRPTVELYFTRHPYELNISPDFVHEMNANVLAILQQSPHAIVDSLSAIGHSYLTSSEADSSLAVLNYRARILATLRAMQLQSSAYNLEVMVFMLLGLSAIELVDCKTWTAPETTLPAVIANAASLLAHHLSTGRPISSLARYFIRALARQDMIISLVHLHRPRIPTTVWLDETALTTADRLMGYTATLMPLLEELCALAEDMRLEGVLWSHGNREATPRDETGGLWSPIPLPLVDTPARRSHEQPFYSQPLLGTYETPFPQATSPLSLLSSASSSSSPPPPTGPNLFATCYAQRAESLRLGIEAWKPAIAHGLSFRNARRYLSQASCYRSGALLYLFRLLHPPHPHDAIITTTTTTTTTNSIDGEATAKAHEVLMSTTGPDSDEVKMLLWPVFLAACEMSAEEDRQMVLDVLDAIMAQRRTVTAQRTKSFVLNRVWPARDEGREWNWMVLAQQYPGECLPI